MRIALKNARLIDPDSGLDAMGGLLLEGDKIIEVAANLFSNGTPSVSKVIDCQGHVLAPGLVDGRVHCREPGEEHKENLETAALAALKGGITTLIQRPDTHPPIDDVPMVERMENLAGRIKGPHLYAIAALTKALKGEEITEIGLMQKAGAVAFGDADKTIKSSRLLRRALSYASSFNALIVQMPQESELTAGGVMNSGALASRMGLAGIPAFAEAMQIERDLRLMESVINSKMHFSLISTQAAVNAVQQAKAKGLDVTCDTAPHYFLMNEQDVTNYRTFAKVFPPLRQEKDRIAIENALQQGIIDMVVSDHNPQDQDSKRLPFMQAEFGVIGLETLLPAMLNLYAKGIISLLEAIRLVTLNPAKRYGIEAGSLKKGAKADIILFNPDFAWKLDEKQLLSKSKNTAFGGREMQGKVLFTMVEGEILYQAPNFNIS